MKEITLGITGASGIPIAFALLKELIAKNCKVHLIITNAGLVTIKQETGIKLSGNPNVQQEILTKYLELANPEKLSTYTNQDWYAPVASGSSVSESMIVCPCSMASLGKIAGGIGDDLLSRAADVILKERKNLVLVARETPLSALHLANMKILVDIGVSILPPVPAFYTHPQTVADIINSIVSKILDQVGIKNDLIKRWGGGGIKE